MLILTVVVIVIFLLAYLLSGPEGIGSPLKISLTGSASVNGVGEKSPTGIQFRARGGANYSSIVTSGGQKTGSYAVQLPNGQTYTVLITFSGPSGVLGTCSAGNFTVSVGSGGSTLLRDFDC